MLNIDDKMLYMTLKTVLKSPLHPTDTSRYLCCDLKIHRSRWRNNWKSLYRKNKGYRVGYNRSIIIPPLYPLFFLHNDFKLLRQRLLWIWKSQQRYLEVSAGCNGDFRTVFEVIHNLLSSMFNIALWKRQKHSVDYEIARNFYTPPKL